MLKAEEKDNLLHKFLPKHFNQLSFNKINFIKFLDQTNPDNVDITTFEQHECPKIIGAILTMNNMSFEMKFPNLSHLLQPVGDMVNNYMTDIMNRWNNKQSLQIVAIVLFPNKTVPAGWDISIIDWIKEN